MSLAPSSAKLSTPWLEALRFAVTIYLPLRVVVSVVGTALVFWLAPTLARPLPVELMGHWNIPLPANMLENLLLTPWLRWDALWFLKTAINGYELKEPIIHHLPLYPISTRLLHEIIGGHIGISALIISNLAFVLGLAYFYRLVRLHNSVLMARQASIYLAIFPTSFFYLVGYTESLFMLGAVGAFYYAQQGKWLKAGLLGVVCALARPQGFLLFFPLALEFWRQTRTIQWRDWLRASPLLLIPLSVMLYASYWHLMFGLPAALKIYTTHWQVKSGFIPGQGLWLGSQAIWQGIQPLNNSIDLAFAVFALVMIVWAFRALQPSYALFMLLNWVVLTGKPVGEFPLLAAPRFVLPLFPIYILLGGLGHSSPLANRLIIYTWLVLLILFTSQFALGGWLA